MPQVCPELTDVARAGDVKDVRRKSTKRLANSPSVAPEQHIEPEIVLDPE